MRPLLREIGIGILVAAVVFGVLVILDEDSWMRGPQLLWIVPLTGVVVGLLSTFRRGARRAGLRWAGHDSDAVEAHQDRAWRRFRAERPMLHAGVVVLVVAAAAGLAWLRLGT